VKFQKQIFKDIDLDVDDSPLVFKSQLWTLSGVPVDRQSIIGLKGGKLKDDSDFNKLNVKPGMTLMLLGTPGELPKEPETKTVFAEDLPPSALISASEANKMAKVQQYRGLLNLGNTCYMNATVQCLAKVPEISTELAGGANSASPTENALVVSLNRVMKQLKTPANDEPVSPLNLLSALRAVNPQFAEQNQTGFYMQQDAEECWSTMLAVLSRALNSSRQNDAQNGSAVAVNPVDRLFGLELQIEDKCNESDEVLLKNEVARILKCHITSKISHLADGLREGMHESGVERMSESLNRMAQWERKSSISKLPPYIALNFVRFLWKPSESVKAKILRPVSFPVELLDLYEYCTPALQEKLNGPREQMRVNLASKSATEAEDNDESSMETEAVPRRPILDSDITGMYQLDAVITHQG